MPRAHHPVRSAVLFTFVNLDLKTLEAHPGLARTIIGALLNAIYNRNGEIKGRTLFLLDEVARLGYLRILETARDAGRKYGISLLLLFQSILTFPPVSGPLRAGIFRP